MSTRTMILVKHYFNGPYELHYRHCDGYPLGLGNGLIEALKQRVETLEVLRIVGAEKERAHPIGKVEDAFLKVHRDLEWPCEISDYNSERISEAWESTRRAALTLSARMALQTSSFAASGATSGIFLSIITPRWSKWRKMPKQLSMP